MARAFGYSIGRLRQTPLNRNILKVPRFFMFVSVEFRGTTEYAEKP